MYKLVGFVQGKTATTHKEPGTSLVEGGQASGKDREERNK